MILYLYKLGTNTPALTIKNARSYTADSVTDDTPFNWTVVMPCVL